MGDQDSKKGSLDRRSVLAAAGIGAGVVAVGAVGYKRSVGRTPRTTTTHELPGADAHVRALFGDLTDGATVDGWTIQRVHAVHMGAIPVVMATAAGATFQVDVMRRDANSPDAVANTASLSLYVANTGDGATTTDEQQGLGAKALAAALAKREQAGAAVPELMTLKERHAAYPSGVYSVPV